MSRLVWLFISIFLRESKACQDISRDCLLRIEFCDSPDPTQRAVVRTSCAFTCNSCGKRKARLPPTTCRDYVLDCYERRELCSRPAYQRMMRRQCPLTCGFCIPESETTGYPIRPFGSYEETTEDYMTRSQTVLRKIEESGISIDDLQRLIRQQVTPSTTTVATTTTALCLDRGIDCADKMGLCSHRSYKTLVEKMCRRTCNLCS